MYTHDYSVVCTFCRGDCENFPLATSPKKTHLIDIGVDDEGRVTTVAMIQLMLMQQFLHSRHYFECFTFITSLSFITGRQLHLL